MGRPVVLVTAAALLTLTATAIAARIDGSPRADFLRGGQSPDRIDGRGGGDKIKVDMQFDQPLFAAAIRA